MSSNENNNQVPSTPLYPTNPAMESVPLNSVPSSNPPTSSSNNGSITIKGTPNSPNYPPINITISPNNGYYQERAPSYAFQSNNSINNASPNQPLLQRGEFIDYPAYHPRRAVVYAKKSKRNCCCVFWGITCCCCLFFGLLIGAIIGGLAYECSQQKYTAVQVYSGAGMNISNYDFSFLHADVTIQQGQTENVTITVTRSASTQSLLEEQLFNLVIGSGEVTFTESIKPGQVWWDAITICQTAYVSISLPVNWNSEPTVSISNIDGDVSITTFTTSFSTVSASSTNGQVSITGVNGISFQASSTNGDVSLTSVTATFITSSSTNGKIKLNEIYGLSSNGSYLTASTTNGDIEGSGGISLQNAQDAQLSFSTTNGHILVSVTDFEGDFSAKTSNGDVSVSGSDVTFWTQQKHYADGMVGAGGIGKVSATSTNGNVNLNFS